VSFELDRDGLALLPGLIDPAQLSVMQFLAEAHSGAGTRIFGNPRLEAWLKGGPVGATVRAIFGREVRPVRAILFDKNAEANWALGWHQDRTIAVRQQVRDEPGFDHWTIKSGVAHVEPPFSFIEKMVTARIHLDDVNDDNGPLLVSPGSHRFGRIGEADVDETVERCGTAACLAGRGDVWLYRTAILHASDKSRSEAPRRVLQVDYSSDDLPGQLEWLGIG